MEKTNIVLKKKEEADKYHVEINTEPEVVLKDEVGGHIHDYWADAVVSEIGDKFGFQWFRIRKDGNRIIIEPVKVEAIE